MPASSVFHKSGLFIFLAISLYLERVCFTYQAFWVSVATLTSFSTMDLMKCLMMHIIGQEQHCFGLIQCTLISILYLSHLLLNKTLCLPQILGQIYT